MAGSRPIQMSCSDVAAWISPGKVIPPTPPRRTSWIPTSPSPLRNSFTTESATQSNENTDNDDDDDDDDEGYIPLYP